MLETNTIKQTYCDTVKNLPNDDINKIYHDNFYGFPIKDDNELFERLILEIN
jgi:DNA-3-methyladenine glycosylase I